MAGRKAGGGNANEHYNHGLHLLVSIEARLRAGTLTDEDRRVAEEAEEEFVTALRIAANHGRAMIMLGMLYRFTARYDEAIPLLELALGLPRDSADWTRAADTLAGALMQSGRHAKAAKFLEDAVTDHAGDPYLVVKLAACYAELGQPQKAVPFLEAGLRLKPGDPTMTSALAEIREKIGGAPSPQPALPPDAQEMQQKAMKLGEALQKKMKAILEGPGSGEEKAKLVTAAQQEFSAAVSKLYNP